MNNITFVDWLEGFLDACKNRPSNSQIREIRKKINSCKSINPKITMLTDSPVYRDLATNIKSNNEPLNEEQQALFEKTRGATTMEELEK